MRPIAKKVEGTRNPYTCKRCGYQWLSKRERKEIKVCAGCHSPYWDKERVKVAK